MTHPNEPGERCHFGGCSNPATHKISEVGTLGQVFILHEMTTYLCCEHMHFIAMPCSAYPYDHALRGTGFLVTDLEDEGSEA